MHRFFTYHHNAGPADQHEGGYFHAGYPEINGAMLDLLLSVRFDSLRIKPSDQPGNFRNTSIYNDTGWRLASVFMDSQRNLRLELTPAEPNPVEQWIKDTPAASLFVSYFLEGGHLLLASPGKDDAYRMSENMVEMINAARMFYDPNVVPHPQEGFLIERRGFRSLIPGTSGKEDEYVQLFDYFTSYENALASYHLQKASAGYNFHYGRTNIMESRLIALPDNNTLQQTGDFGWWNPERFAAEPPDHHFGYLRHSDPQYHPWSGQAMDFMLSLKGDLVDPDNPIIKNPPVRFSASLHLQSQPHGLDTFLNFDVKLLQPMSHRHSDRVFACNQLLLIDRNKATAKVMAEMARGEHLTVQDQSTEIVETNATYLQFNPVFYHNLPKIYKDKFPVKYNADETSYATQISRVSGRSTLYRHETIHAMAVLSRHRQPAATDYPYVPYRARVTYVPFGTARDEHPDKFSVNFRMQHLNELIKLIHDIPAGAAADFSSRFTAPQPISVTVIDSNGKRPVLHLAKAGAIVDLLVMAPDFIPEQVVKQLTTLYRNEHAMVDSPEQLQNLIIGGVEDIAEAVRKYQGPNASQQLKVSR